MESEGLCTIGHSCPSERFYMSMPYIMMYIRAQVISLFLSPC